MEDVSKNLVALRLEIPRTSVRYVRKKTTMTVNGVRSPTGPVGPYVGWTRRAGSRETVKLL